MTQVVVTHAVGDMNKWLAGGANRTAVFSKFSSGHRIFRHADGKRISIILDDVDLDKMQSTLSTPETAAAKKVDTVVDPIEVYIEVPGGK